LGKAHPDADLVGKALGGDRQAFVTLCDEHRTRLWRIAASVARGPDVEDLAQEAVVRAYHSLSGYEGEAPFGAWLCRIAVNVAHDYLRSGWRRRVTLCGEQPLPETEEQDTPEGAAERRELQRRVRQAVASLPDKQRTPIWLHYFEGFSVAEVARLEGVPEGTVRSRLNAGLRRLSLSLDDLVESPLEAPLHLEVDPKGCGA
jgi:RNA polymerase sigma-70 factor, ECF subfamily